MRLKNIFVLTVFVVVAGCSYFKRKDCEAVNWFDYGYKVAMKGQRLTGDSYLNECRNVEADISESNLDKGFKEGMNNYCKPDVVYQTGKQGQEFNTDLCNPSEIRNLQEAHKKGVEQYCQPKNGYEVGVSGNLYTKICPSKLEPAFMPEYKKGRKKFLETLVQEKESRVRDAESKLYTAKNDLVKAEYDEKYANLRFTSIPASDFNRAAERNNAQSDYDSSVRRLNQARSNVESVAKDIEKLKSEIYEHKREITALSAP